jgi:hypothetical protein
MIKKVFQKAMDAIHEADIYGKPITLNYNRQTKFKTKLGGFSTIILGGFMAVYFLFLFWELFAKSTINYTVTTQVEDLAQNPKVHDLGKSGFKIAVGLTSTSYSLFDKRVRKYLELRVSELNQDYNPEGEWETNVRELNLERCGDNFPYHDKVVVK